MIAVKRRGLVAAIAWGLLATFLLLGALWHQVGLIDYVDVNFPGTVEATLTSLRRYSASWDWYANMGRSNPSFLSEQVLLAPYLVMQLLFGTDIASKMMLFGMVFATYCGTVSALRRLNASWFSASASATFAIVNPWFFDEIAQGHIYLLMSAWAVPLACVLFVQARRWSTLDSFLGFFTVFFIVAIDFRFAALIYFVAVVGMIARLRDGISRAERLWRSCALMVPPFLLAFIVFSYGSMFGALRAANAPAPSSVDYYSNFTSLWAALTLVRPNYNALNQLGHLGDRLVYYWAFAYAALLLGAARAFTLNIDRPLKVLCATMIITGVVLGSGLNSPFSAINALLHDRVPLYAELFRDPSKFYVLQVVAYTLLIGLSIGPNVRWPFRRLLDLVEAPISTVVRFVGVPLLATIAAILYLAPFLGWDFSTATAFDPAQNKNVVSSVEEAEHAVTGNGGRFAMFPPGVRVQYTGSATYVYDPLALFPTAPNVRIPVAYDFEPASTVARWSLGTVDSARTTVPGSVLGDLGVDRIAVRALPGQYDLAMETHMLRPVAPVDFVGKDGLIAAGDGVFRTRSGGIALGSNGSVVVDGDRETIVTARSLGVVPTSGAWCFATQCKPSGQILTISDLTAAPPGNDLDVGQFGSADYGPHWIAGSIAWAEMNLNASRSPLPSIVGFGEITGTAVFETQAGDADVWIRAINGGETTSYRLDGFSHPLRLDVPRSLSLGGFKWYRVGRVRLNTGRTSITFTGKGPQLCISNIRLVKPGTAMPRHDIYVGTVTDAASWSVGHTFLKASDWSISGERVFFGGSAPARLDFHTSVPDGIWKVVLRGRSDRRSAAVTVRSKTTCQLHLTQSDSTSGCDVRIRGGSLSFITTQGNVFADGIGITKQSIQSEPFSGERLNFSHGNGSFTVENPKRYRFVAVRVADSELWQSRSARLGIAFGYGMLFDGSRSERIDGILIADRHFNLGLAISALTLMGIVFGIMRRRSRKRAL